MSSSSPDLGASRLQGDMRQMGGLLLLFSFPVLIFPMAGLASLVGPEGQTPSEGMPLSALIGAVFVLAMGSLGIVVGWWATVLDGGSKWMSALLAIFIQLAYVPFVTDLVSIGKGIKSGEAFIPASLNPTPDDVTFAGIMAYFGIFGYAFGYLGAQAFLAFAMFAYQNGNPQARGGSYYRGRLIFYAILQFFAAFGQFGLAAYASAKFGSSRYVEPIGAAVYFIHYPILGLVVGGVVMLNSIFGLLRGMGLLGNNPNDRTFQISSFLSLFVNILGIMIQVSIGEGANFAAMAPSLCSFSFAIHVFPAYLDHKMRSMPAVLPDDYYGLVTQESAKTNKHEVADSFDKV